VTVTLPPDDELAAVFASWVDSPLKVQLSIFYHANPGVIETRRGLARRLGVNEEALGAAVNDHVTLGLIKPRDVGDRQVLLYDRRRRAALDAFIQDAVNARQNRGDAN
jgi:hypothetical protein